MILRSHHHTASLALHLQDTAGMPTLTERQTALGALAAAVGVEVVHLGLGEIWKMWFVTRYVARPI